jgi:hypothetical protein
MTTYRFAGNGSTVTIEAQTWFDARRHAFAVLGTDEITWAATTDRPSIRLTWVGTDAGRRQERHLVAEKVRRR